MKNLKLNDDPITPKGVQIEKQIRAKIAAGDLGSGEKLPSMLNLADQLGVSLGVVKQALHTLTVEGTLQSTPKVGVFVSERRPTKDIALVLPTVELEQIPRIIKGARTNLPDNYRLIIEAATNSFEDQIDLLKHLNSYNISGILFMPPPKKCYTEKIQKLLNRDVPCVQILFDSRELSTDSVTFDGFEMGEQAINYLIEKGHTEIGLIDTDADISTFINRNKGMDSALRRIGKSYETLPKKINHAENLSTDFPGLLGKEAALRLLEKHPELTALIGGNGHILLGAAQALTNDGKSIPDNISLLSMGIDLSLFQHLTPSITAFDEPLEKMCRRAVQLLIARIENPNKERETIQLAPILCERESVKSIRK